MSLLRRVLLLRDARTAATPDWRELEERLPGADVAADREAAGRCLQAEGYDLIVTDAVLPDGGPYGLLGLLLARQEPTTVVVHFRLDGGTRWLRLFSHGEFDLGAEPMTRDDFWRWLEEWLALPVTPPVGKAATDAA